MGRACSTYGEKRNACRIMVGKSEGKKLLGRPRRRWEDNIWMYLRERRWGALDLMHLAKDGDQWRIFVNAAMNLRVP
jgi:hypothetical protein